MLEEIGPSPAVDMVFGRNQWPDAEFKAKLVAVDRFIHNTTLAVLSGADRLVEEEASRLGLSSPQPPLRELMEGSSFLYNGGNLLSYR